MAKIVLEGVTKIFDGTVRAADNINLEIADGQVVSLLGPSGCGKTTTMRLIAGFEEPTAGRIYIDGKEVTSWPPQRRNISMVFQFPVVYDTMTIYENMAVPLRVMKFGEDKIRKIVEEASARFDIDAAMWDKKAKKLSISERQRLSLAHAFALERNVYILDEPFSNIDPKSRIRLAKYVRDIQEKMGHTIIFVTHSQSEALTLSHKIAVMKDGKVLQYGTPEDIYSRPVNTFVGWFLGNPGMNFINCLSRQKSGGLVLDAGSFIPSDKIPSVYTPKVRAEQEVILGIRPEDVSITREEKPGFIPCLCRFTEPIGSRLLLNMELGADIRINVKVPTEFRVNVGDKAYVHFPENRVMLFDRSTGQAL